MLSAAGWHCYTPVVVPFLGVHNSFVSRLSCILSEALLTTLTCEHHEHNLNHFRAERTGQLGTFKYFTSTKPLAASTDNKKIISASKLFLESYRLSELSDHCTFHTT